MRTKHSGGPTAPLAPSRGGRYLYRAYPTRVPPLPQRPDTTSRPTRAGWQLLLQLVVVGGALWYLGRTIYANRVALGNSQVDLSLPELLAGSVITIATYIFMVWTWTWTMRWWGGAALRFAQAWRIWALANLSRFIPGYVWQFAGLAGMSARAGVSPIAATGGVLLQQLVSLLSGAVVCAALFPALAGTALPISYGQAVVIAVAGLAVAILALPHSTALLQRATRRFAGDRVIFPTLRVRGLGVYTAAQLLPWLAYGVAFWLFGRGIVGDRGPGLALATASFTAAYVWGIVWVVAPGGLGVREAALVSLLSPHVGADVAVILALGSRVWLTIVEIIAALVAIGYAATASQPTPTI